MGGKVQLAWARLPNRNLWLLFLLPLKEAVQTEDFEEAAFNRQNETGEDALARHRKNNLNTFQREKSILFAGPFPPLRRLSTGNLRIFLKPTSNNLKSKIFSLLLQNFIAQMMQEKKMQCVYETFYLKICSHWMSLAWSSYRDLSRLQLILTHIKLKNLSGHILLHRQLQQKQRKKIHKNPTTKQNNPNPFLLKRETTQKPLYTSLIFIKPLMPTQPSHARGSLCCRGLARNYLSPPLSSSSVEKDTKGRNC